MKARKSVEDVEQRLRRTVQALNSAGIAYALIGGNAVAVWVATRDEGAVRTTKDVDILMARSDLGAATKAMDQAGFDLAEVNGVVMFLDRADPMPSRAVHLVFAGEKVKPHEILPAPTIKIGTRSSDGAPTLDLKELLILKLIPFRRVDQVHLADLCRVGLVDDQLASQIPPELRAKLDEIRADPDA